MPVNVQNFPLPLRDSVNPETASWVPSLGIYIHIPFCRTKCNYCAFVSAPPQDESAMDRYLEALLRHIHWAEELRITQKINTIYIGGGTPSLLGPLRLARLFETLHSVFTIAGNAEFTLEANPESATRELFSALIPYGLNRVSLGAQSFHDAELQKIGRIHAAEDIRRAVDAARTAGIGNLSLDLIFALPDQTFTSWQDTLTQTLACQPDHLSAYGLTYEEGTLMDRLRQEEKITPVLDETYRSMYDFTRQYLGEQGWRQYEISNWSRSGRESLHNRIYWNREDYLAFGVSAHGMIGSRRYALIRPSEKYIRILQAGNEGQAGGFWRDDLFSEKVTVSPEEMASDAMIFGLRLTEGISIPRFQQRFGYTPQDRWNEAIPRLLERRLLEQNGSFLRLTEEATPISNEVFIHFLD